MVGFAGGEEVSELRHFPNPAALLIAVKPRGFTHSKASRSATARAHCGRCSRESSGMSDDSEPQGSELRWSVTDHSGISSGRQK